MEQRLSAYEKAKGAINAILGISKYLSQSKVEPQLLHLIEFRVSQINGCAYCLDMHSKDLRHDGDTEQRLYTQPARRDAPYYTDRERAALAWAEAITTLKDGDVPDEVYEQARKQFSEEELVDLTLAAATTGSWNRINIAFRTTAGTYQPGQWSTAAK
jgi:AhpD family alkylhydroperoxidase